MKIKNLKIGTQLILGFASMVVFVIVLGVVSYRMNDKLFTQAETIYEHPLKVRTAIGKIEANILTMRLGTRDLMLANNDRERKAAVLMMELAASDNLNQFDVLRSQYLGSHNDVEAAYKAYLNWKISREGNTKLAFSGEIEKIKSSIQPGGDVGILRDELLAKIDVIDNFANDKANILYMNSVHIKDLLDRQLFFIVFGILFLSFLINYVLIRNIRIPLGELTLATKQFHEGDMKVRSSYESKNEFGKLSDSFNLLAESIQKSTELTRNTAHLASLMMSENDSQKFFHSALSGLSTYTGSQMAAVYLLNRDKMTFEHFLSIGIDNGAKKTFSADSFEGEFGAVLSQKRIIHLTKIPEDTLFSFPVVIGKLRPREIITIPILDFNEVVAVVSLASIHDYSPSAIQLLQENWTMMTARIHGVLSFKKVAEFSEKLNIQNQELEQKSTEMSLQADELKEYNIELELQKKQLDEANQLKSAFLSNMSHELRTPLNSVIALSGVLNRRLKNQISEDEYSYLDIIEKNGKNLLSLINDILDLSRIESGKEEISLSVFSVQDLMKSVVDSLSIIAKEKGIALINQVGADLPPIVSDSSKVNHILQNIISNAVKFTEAGAVEISAELSDGKMKIRIKDSGIGISKDELPHIFDEFRQADGRSSRKYGGTGLGLAIAKKYIQFLQGSIEVRSQQGAGSVFVVTLPEKPIGIPFIEPGNDLTKSQSFDISTSTIGFGTSSGKTLLVVEDSEPQIIQLTNILSDEGYLMKVARNGKEALHIIQESIPDAMILDLMMPEVDGFEVLKSIRSRKETSHIPVLILSAKHVTKEELSFLKGNNIHQLIQKGDVNRSELLASVSRMIHPVVHSFPENADKTQLKNEKAKILLIEDNPDNTTTVKALLDGKFELIEENNGLTGLDKAKMIKPNLILLALSLPGLDGFSVLKEIKKDTAIMSVPVIALTARAMKGDRESLIAQGFDDYISKPIDNELFERTIQQWLRANS
jgi:signal transduction histidine kinase/CheY-like chemotaxis protein/HAMP domain-containing protein